MVLESEGEGDDWRDISANNFELISNGDILQADNFVIVNYKGRHYPGGKKNILQNYAIILDRILAVNEGVYEVTAAILSGRAGKWPLIENNVC